MLNKIFKKIKNEKIIVNGDKIVLGFSGGPDSIFLLDILNHFKKIIDFEIILVHINHLLRGENSDTDEKFCVEVAKQMNMKIFVKRCSVENFAKENKITLEEAGRIIRYDFFNEILEKTSSNKIAVAHNLDDQIENFLFRLIRGTSLDGLKGIQQRENIIRPINEIYKKDILDYLEKNKIPYRIDETNLENEFTRNSIRLDLIPFIEKRYNIQFKEKIHNIINEINEVNEILQVDLDSYKELYDNYLSLSISKIKKEKLYIQRKIISEYLKENYVEPSQEKIQNILKLFESDGSKFINLENTLILKKEYNFVRIEKIKKNIEKNIMTEQTIPFSIKFNEYIIEATEIVEESLKDSKNFKNEFLTNLKVGDTILIRTRESGDKIKPIGMTSFKSLKDIFINEKIPKEIRNEIPIFIKNNEIIWVSGVKKSETFKFIKNTKGIKLIVRRHN